MKQVFRFKISLQGVDDSFYFTMPPTMDDILKAIEENRKLAGEVWEEDYAAFTQEVKKIPLRDWDYQPQVLGARCGTGGPIKNSQGDIYGTYSFDRYKVKENGR